MPRNAETRRRKPRAALRATHGKRSIAVKSLPALHQRTVAGQGRILEMIATGAPLERILDALVRLVEGDLPGIFASVLILDEDGAHLRHGAAPSLPDEYRRRVDGEPIGPSAGSCGTAAWRGETVIVEDMLKDPLWETYRDLARASGLRASWSTPIFDASRRVLGTFALYSRSPGRPTKHHLSLVEMATHTAAIAIARLREERALREGEARYRALAVSSPDAILIHSDHRIVFVNRALLDLLGARAPEDLIGRSATFMLPPEFAETARGRIAKLYAGVALPRAEQVYLRLDGKPVHVEIASAPLRFEGAPAAQVTVRDISERKRAEEGLKRFRVAMDSSSDMVALIDRASMRYIDVNASFTRLLGYSREEMLARGPHDVMPVTREAIEKIYDALIAEPGQPQSLSSYYVCKDGSHLPMESNRHAFFSEGRWLIVAMARDVRERIASDRAIRESERQMRGVLEGMTVGFLGLGRDWRITYVNAKAAEIIGRGPEQLLGRKYLEAFPESAGSPFELDYRAVMAGGAARSTESYFEPWDRWFDQRVEPTPDGISIFFRDITDRKRQEQRIERLSRVRAVTGSINALIVRERDREQLCREACRIAVEAGGYRMAWTGFTNLGNRSVDVVASFGASDEYLAALPLALDETGGEDFGLAGRALRALAPLVVDDLSTDTRITLHAQAAELGLRSAALLPLMIGGIAVGVLALYSAAQGFFDAEEMKLLEEMAGDLSFALEHIEKSERIDYLAYYDPLTGLANRKLFGERLGQHLQAAAGEGCKVAVAVIDLERFKSVNEGLGRQVGDELLRQVTRRLNAFASETTGFGRLDRDQFAVMSRGLPSAEAVARLAETRLKELFAAPFLIGGHELRISAKAGIALFPDDGTDPETLLRNAEAALKNAKAGGERYLFHAQPMTERVAERLSLENKLRQALERSEFVLHYQPKVSLATGRIVGLEALIRWQSAELGLVPPGRFIPLMEETGLILEAGAWALRQAARDHRRWSEAGQVPPRVAVNVSAIQLRKKDFVATVEEALREGLTPSGIDLEITESLMMEDMAQNIEKMRAARALGLGIAIDDFGTGYSSLAYLAKLPVQTLKIDRSFIITMLADPQTLTLVQTMVSLAHSLGLKVVAEGVDSTDQAAKLRELACDEIQGFLFSKPLPFDGVSGLLSRGASFSL